MYRKGEKQVTIQDTHTDPLSNQACAQRTEITLGKSEYPIFSLGGRTRGDLKCFISSPPTISPMKGFLIRKYATS